jgi:DNA-binding MarR family transcriptional regulator
MTVEATVPWLDADEQRAWRAYLRASRLLEVALDRDLRVHGVQLSEYEILSMLSEQPELSMRMSELADLVVQSRSRLTHTAARLERAGWVEREPCLDDRRGVILRLTPAGLDRTRALAAVHVASVRAHLVDILSPQDYTHLGDVMARVREALIPGRSAS